MSLHKSLKSKNVLGGHRNVLTRTERIAKLKEQERFGEEESIFGLPKVRNIKVVTKSKKKKKKDEEEAAEAASAEA